MSCSKPKLQHIDLTLKENLENFSKLEYGMKVVDVCKTYNLSQSTLFIWKKQKSKLNDVVDVGKALDTKHKCESFLPNIKRVLHILFGTIRSKPHTLLLSKQVLVEKAT